MPVADTPTSTTTAVAMFFAATLASPAMVPHRVDDTTATRGAFVRLFNWDEIICQAIAQPSDKVEAEFNERANRWERQTAIHSAPAPKILHSDYQTIIGKLGRAAIPFILKRLPASGSDWLWALEHITGENPAKDAGRYADAVQAWLQWGRDKEHIK